ncbi:unnamed protein product, partial [Laminaria digitata]
SAVSTEQQSVYSMPRTRSASASAAGAGERHQRQKKQQPKQQTANKLGASVPPTTCKDDISNKNSSSSSSSSTAISNNSNATVARARAAIAPASTKGRLSLGPVPKERYSMESGLLSFSSDDLSPSPPGDRRSSPGYPSRHYQQHDEETPADDIIISSNNNNGSNSSSCGTIDIIGGIDTQTSDNHNIVEHDLLNSSIVSIELNGLVLDHGASLSLPPLGEIFSPDRKQQQQQQQQKQHDLSPVPLVFGSRSGIPDTVAAFDFDVDEVDALIGELAEKHGEEHDEQCFVGEQRDQGMCLQQLRVQEEEG